jgi:hypothetical protein
VTSPATPDFSIKPVLTGEKVVLRPFDTADFPALLAALADPEVLRRMRGRGRPQRVG